MSAPRLLPMLAGGVGIPPRPETYQLEPKLDGQRVVVRVEDGRVTLSNRRGGELSAYPEVAALAGALPGRAAVLDGEVVTFDAQGRSSFQRLQRRMHVARPSDRLVAECPVVFVAFDVLWLDGESLVDRPQEQRRRALEDLRLDGPAWQTARVLDASPAEALEACRTLGLEGFMAKRRDARYQPGRRSTAWWKIKCVRRRDFVVGGWSPGQGGRAASVGSLALGSFDVDPEEAERRGHPAQLVYAGQAGSGLTEPMIAQLRKLFDQIAEEDSLFAAPPPLPLHFVRPLLVVEVAYSEVTDDGLLRHPSIKGLRTDVAAAEVVQSDEVATVDGGRG